MKIIREALDYSVPPPFRHVHFATTNMCVKNDGKLVMGRGNAKSLSNAHSHAAAYFGSQVKEGHTVYLGTIGPDLGMIGGFTVKDHWKEPASLDLLISSTNKLIEYAMNYPQWTFHLPMPAVGLGGMPRHEVIDVIRNLPDNVLVYEVPR